MSWSLSASGGKAAVKRQLATQKLHGGASTEEHAVFDRAKAILVELVDATPDPTQGDGYAKAVTTVKVSAAGHGTTISCLSHTHEQHQLE